MHNVAWFAWARWLCDVAEKIFRAGLEARQITFGRDDAATLASSDMLTTVLRSQGKYSEAEDMNLEAIGEEGEGAGGGHPGTLTSMNNLPFTYLASLATSTRLLVSMT